LEEVGDWPHGNPGDEVELEGSLIVDAVKQRHGRSEAELAARVDRWLEEGQDEYVSKADFLLIQDPSTSPSTVTWTTSW